MWILITPYASLLPVLIFFTKPFVLSVAVRNAVPSLRHFWCGILSEVDSLCCPFVISMPANHVWKLMSILHSVLEAGSVFHSVLPFWRHYTLQKCKWHHLLPGTVQDCTSDCGDRESNLWLCQWGNDVLETFLSPPHPSPQAKRAYSSTMLLLNGDRAERHGADNARSKHCLGTAKLFHAALNF